MESTSERGRGQAFAGRLASSVLKAPPREQAGAPGGFVPRARKREDRENGLRLPSRRLELFRVVVRSSDERLTRRGVSLASLAHEPSRQEVHVDVVTGVEELIVVTSACERGAGTVASRDQTLSGADSAPDAASTARQQAKKPRSSSSWRRRRLSTRSPRHGGEHEVRAILRPMLAE